MKKKTVNNHTIVLQSPEPVIRTITIKLSQDLWKGCIYISAFDSTGEVLQIMKTRTSDWEGTFLKNPIYFFKSSDKTGIEEKINNKIHSLITSL